MQTVSEGVVCVYDNSTLVAIVKRDATSKKNIVYVAMEASVEEIANLISNKDR